MSEGDSFKWAVSIDSVEVFAALDFFPGLEDGLVERIDGNLNLTVWK